eukprot:s3299_g4.t1
MMLSAALCAMSAALAASAAYAARKVVKKLEDVEAAVWFYADKVQAGEFRQDRAAGLQNDVEDGDLKNGCSIFAAVVAGQIQMHPAACPQTTIAEWRQLAGTEAMQGFGLKPMVMQIEDRVQEVQTLYSTGSSAGSNPQLRAAVQKVQSML